MINPHNKYVLILKHWKIHKKTLQIYLHLGEIAVLCDKLKLLEIQGWYSVQDENKKDLLLFITQETDKDRMIKDAKNLRKVKYCVKVSVGR